MQFVQYHAFMPEYWEDPWKMLGYISQNPAHQFRILLSHMPVLEFPESYQPAIDLLKPSLILSGHNHLSNHYKQERFSGRSTTIESFLRSTESLLPGDPTSVLTSKYFPFNLSRTGETLHEINVPTCSYRMGVPDMGYGYLELYPDGTSTYTVLWTPSRFYQLHTYLILYILLKITGCYTNWECLCRGKRGGGEDLVQDV